MWSAAMFSTYRQPSVIYANREMPSHEAFHKIDIELIRIAIVTVHPLLSGLMVHRRKDHNVGK